MPAKELKASAKRVRRRVFITVLPGKWIGPSAQSLVSLYLSATVGRLSPPLHFCNLDDLGVEGSLSGRVMDGLWFSQTDFRRRRALKTTDAELKLIAKAANMGESNSPVKGYKTPAANGTPKAL